MRNRQSHSQTIRIPTDRNLVDIKHYVYCLDRMSWLIGVSFQKPHNFRVYLLVIGILFELITTVIGDYFLEYDEKLFLSLGNIPSYFFTDQRNLISPSFAVYRLVSLIFVVNHLWWTDHQWLETANSRFHQLPSRFAMDKPKLDSTMRRCQIYVVVNFVTYLTSGTSTVLIWYWYMRSNTFQEILPTLIVTQFSTVHLVIQAIFLAQYYLICTICVQMANQINLDLLTVLSTQNWNLTRLNHSLAMFTLTCNIISECNRFMSRVYAIYLIFVMTFVAPLIYALLYLRVINLVLQVILSFLVYFILQIFFISSMAGQIDVQTKTSIERLYREFVCKHNLNDSQKIALKMRIIQFFDQVESSSIGISIMGKPINTSTCITIATGFMSILALLLGNRKMNVCTNNVNQHHYSNGFNVTVNPFQYLNDTLIPNLFDD